MKDEKILDVDEMINKISALRIIKCISMSDKYGIANVDAVIEKCDDHYKVKYNLFNDSLEVNESTDIIEEDLYPEDENQDRMYRLMVKRPQFIYAAAFIFMEDGKPCIDLLLTSEKGDHTRGCFTLFKSIIEDFMEISGYNTLSKITSFVEKTEKDFKSEEEIMMKFNMAI